MAADAIGRLCGSMPDAFVAKQIKLLADLVISNREPSSRAGSAFALGSILYYVGGMAAGLHLRMVLGLLLSLATDPHPTVHLWALEALEKTINSSGLGFTSHVPSCLGAISSLVLSDTYDAEDVTSSMSNWALQSPTLPSLVRCLDAIINVVGPDLASSKKSRALIGTLLKALEHDADVMVVTESTRCYQHLILYVPESVNLRRFIQQLEKDITSGVPQSQQLSCEVIYGLMRKDSAKVFEFASKSFGDTLWSLLNQFGSVCTDSEEIIRCWMEQTATSDIYLWIAFSLKFLAHSGQLESRSPDDAKADGSATEPVEFIDEAAAFSTPAQLDGIGLRSASLRWQGVSFALTCLRRVVELNCNIAKREDNVSQLADNVGDLIRVAFTACTSVVVDIRLGGLRLLHDIIKVDPLPTGVSEIKGFAPASDPDFPDSPLLEQYQAQIASALTPAFAVDSSPEIAAEAISICAEFISSNIVKDVNNLPRLLKILIAGLQNIAGMLPKAPVLTVEDENGTVFLGELKIPSSNARLLLKLAVLSAWSEIQIQSTRWDYVEGIVAPYVSKLVPLWLSTLTAFATLQFDPEPTDGIMDENVMIDGDALYASKELLLRVRYSFFY
jgi:HEAT repeat-containing protein 5